MKESFIESKMADCQSVSLKSDDDNTFLNTSEFSKLLNHSVQTVEVTGQTIQCVELEGGADKPDGPHIYISNLPFESDVHNYGRLSVGDILISIDNKSFVDISYEHAKNILAHLSSDVMYEISFIKRSTLMLTFRENSEPRVVEGSESTRERCEFSDPQLNKLLAIMRSLNGSQALDSQLSDDTSVQVSLVDSQQSETCKSFAIDSSSPVNLNKLESAILKIGLFPTETEKRVIRDKLATFRNGTVLYGEFVKVVKEVLGLDRLNDGKSFDGAFMNPHCCGKTCQMSVYRDELRRLRKERDVALKDVATFRSKLLDKDRQCVMLMDDMDKVTQQLITTRTECNSLRRQAHISEQSRKLIESKQKRCEEKIQRLEKELSENQSKESCDEMNKRLNVISCQLKKNESSIRAYEVAVAALTNHVQKVRLFTERECAKIISTNTGSKRLQKDFTKMTAEANETIKAVKVILEKEVLPFGWEEVYTANGERYFVSHVYQTTSWVHPASGIHHSAKEPRSHET